MSRRILGLVCASLFGLLLVGLPGGAIAAPLACDVTSFSGQVTKTGLPLTVHSSDGKDRTVSAGPNLVVVRNGQTVGLSDVREGDQVNVTVPAGAADCTATRIEATTTPVVAQEKDRTGLWGLLGLLGLAGLIPLLRDRLRPPHRIERVEGHSYATAERVEQPEPIVRIERNEPADSVHEIETRPIRR
jgi:hypothetical protein